MLWKLILPTQQVPNWNASIKSFGRNYFWYYCQHCQWRTKVWHQRTSSAQNPSPFIGKFAQSSSFVNWYLVWKSQFSVKIYWKCKTDTNSWYQLTKFEGIESQKFTPIFSICVYLLVECYQMLKHRCQHCKFFEPNWASVCVLTFLAMN